MTKEKQIEEMAFDLCRIDNCKHLPQEECNKTTCAHCEAEALYNAGYRKQSEIITLYDRIKAMPIDEMASFFVYLEQNQIITTADRYICQKCKSEHGGHCPIGDEKCLYDMSNKETIKYWLEGSAYGETKGGE